MLLLLDNDQELRGDALISASFRSDLSPIPMTLEADIRVDEDTLPFLQQGSALTTLQGVPFEIVKREHITQPSVTGGRMTEGVRITALPQSLLPLAYVRESAVVREDTTLLNCMRSCGATIRSLDADFTVPRFSCLVGQTPTFSMRRVLQEQGGAVRWKQGRLQFRRYADLISQEPTLNITGVGTIDTQSGFLERHQVPSYFGVDDAGGHVSGSQAKARSRAFAPGRTPAELRNMTKSLVHRLSTRVPYDIRICAGEVVEHYSLGKLVIATAVHAVGDTQSAGSSQYTKLFLSSYEE